MEEPYPVLYTAILKAHGKRRRFGRRGPIPRQPASPGSRLVLRAERGFASSSHGSVFVPRFLTLDYPSPVSVPYFFDKPMFWVLLIR